ncbi:recombinase family protein [Streptomyces sp. DT24]|uniref:recombinase family protein n=1 Tax=unclassified Streptomyces TaxID=2593676 RepID=UPI0023B8BC8B|nr:recombinase family protein [Streptomyces sp. AM 4-1-1]WEH34707.1 recombinase family protein [Streptomyces sp. AM 4-1-1]
MTPLIFGYMRVNDDMSDEEAARKQDAMSAYAEANGFQLAVVFHEYVSGAQTVFTEMVDVVRQARARHVIVTSYRELALNRSLQDAMTLHLSCAADADIISLDEC